MHLLLGADLSCLLRNLSKGQCERLINVLEECLKAFSVQPTHSNGEKCIHQLHRTIITNSHDNTVLFMPSSTTKSAGVKVVTLSSGGALGMINIFSSDGRLQGLLNAEEVTAFHTALATMSLFQRCQFLEKESITILGSGQQAEWHARLALLLFPTGAIKNITFVNRGRRRLEDLENDALVELRGKYPMVNLKTLAKEGSPEYEDKLRTTIGSSNIIFSCTPSTVPLFPYMYLQGEASRRRFISLIGSYKPHMREVDMETLLSGGKIYVDLKEACMVESGELIIAKVQESHLVEISEIFTKKDTAVPDVSTGQNIIFKCVGMGIMDLVVGETLLELGLELGIGTEVNGF